MNNVDRSAHWETVDPTRRENERSWFQQTAAPSLEVIDLAQLTPDSALIDIGGGASRLVDSLVARVLRNVTLRDLSESALTAAKARLGDQANNVQWVVADVTTWEPAQTYDLWHDRAAFHFLTDDAARSAYVDRLKRALKPAGHVVIGTFALNGPERCSGLPVTRHDAVSLATILGPEFELIDTRPHEHVTPWGSKQHFQFSTFRRG